VVSGTVEKGGGIVVFGKVERRWGTDGTMCNVQCELCMHVKSHYT